MTGRGSPSTVRGKSIAAREMSRYAATGMPFSVWWALALGACLGGNATIVGASANVIVAGLAERAGYPISFAAYLKYGLIITLESLVISSLYIWLRYL